MSLEIFKNQDSTFAVYSTISQEFIADKIDGAESVANFCVGYFEESRRQTARFLRDTFSGFTRAKRAEICKIWLEAAESAESRESFEAGLVRIHAEDIELAADLDEILGD